MIRILGLRAALILLVLIAIAPVFGVVVQASLAERSARVQRAETSLRSIAELGAAQQERFIEGARQVLAAIAYAPPVYQGDAASCVAYMHRLQQQYSDSYGTFGMIDRQGRLACRGTMPANPVHSGDRLFFRTAIQTGRFSVGEFTISRASQRPVLTFGLPVFRDEARTELAGVAYLALDLTQADQQLRRISLAPEMTLLVSDGNGVVIAAAGPRAVQVGTALPEEFLRRAVAGGRPVFARDQGGDTAQWLYAVQPTGRGGEGNLYVTAMVSSADLLAPSAHRLQLQLAALAAITLLAAFAAWLCGDRILARPISRMLARIDALRRDELPLDAPGTGTRVRELRELDDRFREMARGLVERAVMRDSALSELARQKMLLESVLESLERRVDERTRELAMSNRELESFSYSVSHDLRAPLQAIDGFGKSLLTRHSATLDEQGRHFLERIRENTRLMSGLIDDLLSLARVTRTELQCEAFDLAPKAEQIVERLRHQFPERIVHVEIESRIPCSGDPRLLMIVLANLIGNAWKFTARTPGARIQVGHRRAPNGEVTYFVSDNGAGFDMAYAGKIFNAFQRLHTPAEFEGAGIGLATVHRVITRHGGRVWAESSPGEGATFLFTLQSGANDETQQQNSPGGRQPGPSGTHLDDAGRQQRPQ